FLQSAYAESTGLVLTRAPRDRPLPLSSAQQRLWFLNQLSPNDTVYNVGVAIEIAEPVDQTALARSIVELANRHDILRTVFATTDGEPSQVVTAIHPKLAVADLGPLSPVDRAHRI